MINDYGWSDRLGLDFAPHAARGLLPGRVTVQHRGHFTVVTDRGDLAAQLSGRLVRWRNFRKPRRELAFMERKDDRLAREAERKR